LKLYISDSLKNFIISSIIQFIWFKNMPVKHWPMHNNKNSYAKNNVKYSGDDRKLKIVAAVKSYMQLTGLCT
jgi:hypothetical protein